MIRVLIVEDEAPAARRLEKMLAEVAPQMGVVAVLDTIESAVALLRSDHRLDLILMDIHLADGDCFEIFNQVTLHVPIVFTTAYDAYALQAFKVHAIDYLLKPIKREDLAAALDKYARIHRVETDYAVLTQPPPQYQSRFLIKMGQNLKVVAVADAAYIYTEDKITYLMDQNGKRFPLDFTLDKLESMLDPRSFFRVNRQFILSVAAIKEMHAHTKSRIKIGLTPVCKSDCIVSYERTADFKKWLSGEA